MILILLLLITVYLIKNSLSSFGEMIDDLLTYKNKKSDEDFVIMARNKKPEDISVKPYGCFKDLNERFFIRKLNPFSKVKIFNSVFVISENSMQRDFQTLFDEITQLGTLCLYAGYSYMSIFKTSLDGNMRIYFSYSPPMNRLNISGQFNQKEYNKYLLKSDLNYSLKFSSSETMCGYPCNSKNPDYYCGSLNYPNIKSPATFAVYSVS